MAAEPTTVRIATDHRRVPSGVRAALLAASYAAAGAATAGLSLLAAVYLNAAVALPVAAQLLLWVAGVAGVVASPSAARIAVARLVERLDARSAPSAGRAGAPRAASE